MASLINKWLILGIIPFISGLGATNNTLPEKYHPFHVSVVEINHNLTDKTLEISCKLFTDDFEKALAGHFKTKVDLINPTDKNLTSKYVNDFVQAHFKIKVDGREINYSIIGFEEEGDAVYSYFQADNVESIRKMEMTNSLLYSLFDDQIGIMHVIVGDKRKSTRISYPEKKAEVIF